MRRCAIRARATRMKRVTRPISSHTVPMLTLLQLEQVSDSTHAAYEVLTHHHAPSSASLASLNPHPRKLQRARSRTVSLSLKAALHSLIGHKPKDKEGQTHSRTPSDAPISRAKSDSRRRRDDDRDPHHAASRPSSSADRRPSSIGRRASANRASPNAIKLFAVRELEEDLAERRGLLGRLCAEFGEMGEGEGDGEGLQGLQGLQREVEEVMDGIRLTVVKLRAVRSFDG